MRQPWYTTAKIIFVILLAICLLIIPVSADIVDGQVFNNRTALSLLGTSNTTDAPYHLIISNTTGTNSTEQLFVKSSILANFNDVRFTGSSGELLKYYLHAKNLTIADFIVKLPVVSTVTPATLNVYYGNQTAPSNISTFSSVVTGLNATALSTSDIERFPFNLALGAYNPNTTIAYSDDFTIDTESRFGELEFINGDTWLSVPAGDVSVDGEMLNTQSTNANRIFTVLRSYKFKSGYYKADFVGKTTGAATRCNGLVFGWQDNQSYYVFNVSDTFAGAKNLSIYKFSAGTPTLISTIFQNNTGYLTYGNLTTLEVYWDSERGVISGYAYNATYMPKNATSADVTAYDATFAYGRFGMRSTADTVGGLNANWDNIEIRAHSLIGETNIPQTESGYYFRDEFGVDSTRRYVVKSYFGPTVGVVGGKYSISGDGVIAICRSPVVSSGTTTIDVDVAITAPTKASQAAIIFNWQGLTPEAGSYSGGGSYELFLQVTNNLFRINRIASDGTRTVLSSTTKTISSGNTYHVKVVFSPDGLIQGYFDGEVSPSVSTTDTTYLSGAIAMWGSCLSGETGTITFDNLTISGTRYYMKPMLRGAQKGKALINGVETDCTAFSDDFNWPTSGEYTNVGTAGTWDTTNGNVYFSGANRGAKPSNLKWTSQVATVKVSTTSTSNYPVVTLLDDGNDGGSFGSLMAGTKYAVYRTNTTNLRLSKVVAGSATTLKDCTIPTISANTVNEKTIVYLASTGSFSIYWNGILVGTATDTSITTANPTGIGCAGFSSGSVKFFSLNINALESTSTNGVTYTLGGVPHGARYNWTEYTGLQTTPASTPIYLKLIVPSFSTTTMATANNLTITNATGTTVTTFRTGANPTNQNLLGFNTQSIHQPSAGTVTAVVNATNPQIDNRNATFLMPIIIPDYFFGQQTNLTANFTATPSTGYNPLPVQFNDTSYSPFGTTTWNWTFPDGTYNSTQNPAHLFLTSGNWSVRLAVTDISGTMNAKNLTVRVDDGTPLAMFVPAEAISIWWPATVTWNSTSTNNPTSYLWEFGDGTNATSSNVTHFYTMPGIYPIKFTATNAAGSTSNMTAVQEMM